MRQRTGASTGTWIVVIFVIAALTFVGTFELTSGILPLSTTTTTVSSDQALINQLVSQNSQLQRELASATQNPGSTSLGLNSEAIYQNVSDGIVTVQGTVSNGTVLGSGFVVVSSQSFYIVTNYHVVRGVSGVTVTFQDGDAYSATVVGTDGYSDLAVLKVTAPGSEFHPLDVVSSSQLVVGQPVAAIGNPFGLSGSMTVGIVSQLGRTITESLAGNFAIANVIQFDAPINPGNSGGPLLNANGAVVGITTAVVQSSQGVGFAIPSDTILKELTFLITTGSYNLHPFMGISSVDMNYQLAQDQKTNYTYGVLIENLTAGGPADKAGLKGGTQTAMIDGESFLIGGDQIIGVNGTKIVNTDALSSYLAEYALAGQTLHLTIVRSGQVMTVDIVLGTRPPPPSP